MRILLLCALIALPATLVRAQSLGQLAAQEKARRERERDKKARPAAKVYTENDLLEGGTGSSPPSTPNPPPAPVASAPTATPPSQSESEPSSEADSALRERIAEAKANLEALRQELSAAEAEVERLKQDLNPMSTTYQDDAYVLFRLQGQLKEFADKADALRPKVAEAQKALEAAELAGRHAGVRPE
jgi:peptidoglycan hydrolase CwlO-like protein